MKVLMNVGNSEALSAGSGIHSYLATRKRDVSTLLCGDVGAK